MGRRSWCHHLEAQARCHRLEAQARRLDATLTGCSSRQRVGGLARRPHWHPILARPWLALRVCQWRPGMVLGPPRGLPLPAAGVGCVTRHQPMEPGPGPGPHQGRTSRGCLRPHQRWQLHPCRQAAQWGRGPSELVPRMLCPGGMVHRVQGMGRGGGRGRGAGTATGKRGRRKKRRARAYWATAPPHFLTDRLMIRRPLARPAPATSPAPSVGNGLHEGCFAARP